MYVWQKRKGDLKLSRRIEYGYRQREKSVERKREMMRSEKVDGFKEGKGLMRQVLGTKLNIPCLVN